MDDDRLVPWWNFFSECPYESDKSLRGIWHAEVGPGCEMEVTDDAALLSLANPEFRYTPVLDVTLV